MGADVARIAVRFGLYLDLMLLFGVAAYCVLERRLAETGIFGGPRRFVMPAASAGLILTAVGFWLTCADMMGVAVDAVDPGFMKMTLAGSIFGWACIARFASLCAVLALAASGRSGDNAWQAAVVGGGIALASLAWAGHGAMDEGVAGDAHLVADILHLLSSSFWIGALLVLSCRLTLPRYRDQPIGVRRTADALSRFSAVGSVLVGVIVVTGVVNGLMIFGSQLWALPVTRYGQLLIMKLVLFGGMLALAADNRFRLSPALKEAVGPIDTDRAVAKLRRSLTIESGTAVAVLACVAWLGTLAPPGD